MSRNPSISFEPIAGPIRVAIVSTDPLVRAGIASVLDQADGTEVTDLEEADVAVCDLGADGDRVVDILGDLDDISVPAIAVLPDPDSASVALAAGAQGVVLRDHVGPSLVPALTAVRSGLTVLDPMLAEGVVAARPRDIAVDAGLDALTAREHEVVELLAEGLSNKRIAKRLEISEHTVKFHVNSILSKLAADTRTEAVVEAFRRGILAL